MMCANLSLQDSIRSAPHPTPSCSLRCCVPIFETDAFAGRPVVIARLKPDDVRKFIAARLDKVGTTSNAIMLASVLRAYFRYRATCGDEVYGLLGVISSPAHWNLASLPQACLLYTSPSPRD